MPAWFANILLVIVGTLLSGWGFWATTTIQSHDRVLTRLEYQVGEIYDRVVPPQERKAMK